LVISIVNLGINHTDTNLKLSEYSPKPLYRFWWNLAWF